jgi:tight adherence protein B
LFLRFKIRRRQKHFMDDFADALESMMRLLKAGMPVSEAIKMVAREFTGPMGEEMERIFDQQKIGVPLPEAVLDAARRMPLTEMQMFATAIAIQTQTGSSLSEVLQNLANVIRARFSLKRKVQALSSEAKASAGIIGALPVLVGLGLYFINPEYIELLFTDSTGKFLLGCAVAWMGVGVLVMRQMINFRV